MIQLQSLFAFRLMFRLQKNIRNHANILYRINFYQLIYDFVYD